MKTGSRGVYVFMAWRHHWDGRLLPLRAWAADASRAGWGFQDGTDNQRSLAEVGGAWRVGTAAPGEPILIASELRQSHKVGSPWVRFHHSGERMVKVNYWLTQTGLPVITHSALMLRMQFPIHSYRQRSHSQGGGPPPPICSQGSTFSFRLFLIRRIRTPT